MIVWCPDHGGSPAYGVAEAKALGHPQQSCKGGHPIYHFVAAWTHREHVPTTQRELGAYETALTCGLWYVSEQVWGDSK
jgi:hypothetical protein